MCFLAVYSEELGAPCCWWLVILGPCWLSRPSLPAPGAVATLPVPSPHCGQEELWLAGWLLLLWWILSFLGSCCMSPAPREHPVGWSWDPNSCSLGKGWKTLASLWGGRHSWWRHHTTKMRQFSQSQPGCYCIFHSSLCKHKTSLVAFSVPGNAGGTERGRWPCSSALPNFFLLPSLCQGCQLGSWLGMFLNVFHFSITT